MINIRADFSLYLKAFPSFHTPPHLSIYYNSFPNIQIQSGALQHVGWDTVDQFEGKGVFAGGVGHLLLGTMVQVRRVD
jgi:hypothetical protein